MTVAVVFPGVHAVLEEIERWAFVVSGDGAVNHSENDYNGF